jgi:hypothetical protein
MAKIARTKRTNKPTHENPEIRRAAERSGVTEAWATIRVQRETIEAAEQDLRSATTAALDAMIGCGDLGEVVRLVHGARDILRNVLAGAESGAA